MSELNKPAMPQMDVFGGYTQPDAEGWIEWKGGECPVPCDAIVMAKLRDGSCFDQRADDWIWTHYLEDDGDIIAYRVVK